MHTWDDLQYDCDLESGLTESGKAKLKEAFDLYCLENTECRLNI